MTVTNITDFSSFLYFISIFFFFLIQRAFLPLHTRVEIVLPLTLLFHLDVVLVFLGTECICQVSFALLTVLTKIGTGNLYGSPGKTGNLNMKFSGDPVHVY